MRPVLATLALSALLLAAGCPSRATVAQLRTRAAFDFQCPEEQLDVVALDRVTNGVRGCGQQGTYVEHCKPCGDGYVGCDCTWLLNTDGRRNRAGGQPAANP